LTADLAICYLNKKGIGVQIKDRVVVEIKSIAFGGEGVGRIDNFVVFVPFSAPGDELEIEVIQIKKKFVRGRISKIIESSSARIQPLCRYYEKCGGCCYQHLNYEQQLKIKKQQVGDAFRRIGKIASPPVSDVIASPEIYHYRGKAQFHAKRASNGWEIGFLDISGGKLLGIETCAIMEGTINKRLQLLKENNLLKSDQDGQLTIWSENIPGEIKEKESIVRLVKGKELLVPRDGFFQANLFLTDRLVDEVCRLAVVGEIDTLVDAYCGSGLFSIYLSPYAKHVIGIEINEKSVQFAKKNAENRGVKNTGFIYGDIEKVLKERLLPSQDKIDLFVLDPPRTGCEKTVLKSITDLRPRSIIYISCNPATQARDVLFLSECGYDLRSLLPIDMFPQTEHIEVIGFLERK
jgi:23S rRNA (uracil1939-C5)-methyltransferase